MRVPRSSEASFTQITNQIVGNRGYQARPGAAPHFLIWDFVSANPLSLTSDERHREEPPPPTLIDCLHQVDTKSDYSLAGWNCRHFCDAFMRSYSRKYVEEFMTSADQVAWPWYRPRVGAGP